MIGTPFIKKRKHNDITAVTAAIIFNEINYNNHSNSKGK